MNTRATSISASVSWHAWGHVQLASLERSMAELAEKFSTINPQPQFDRRVGWAASYENLFRSEFHETLPLDDIVPVATGTGRVLLTGRGGSGKTIVLRVLFQQALELGMLPFLVDLSRWSGPDYGSWEALGAEDASRINFLLAHFAEPSTTVIQLDAIPPNRPKLLLVDGLSEITASVGSGVLTAFDSVVRDLVQTSVIATDRMVRRDFRNPDRWKLGELLQLSEDEVHSILTTKGGDTIPERGSAAMSLLRTPFFLNERIRTGGNASTGSAALREFFHRHAGLEDAQLDAAARAAFHVYRTDGARSFSLREFEEVAGHQIVQRLMQAGILIASDQSVAFAHQLEHDYLASRHVAFRQVPWDGRTFDTVSLQATSFDTIALSIEQLETQEADDLVRSVYDWNVYAPAYAMAEGKRRGSLRVSREMELVMLAILAEKRWDILRTSAEKASDALGVYSSSDALHLLEAESLDQVLDVVRMWKGEAQWFGEWKALFVRPAQALANDSEVHAIGESMSILGWTAANVLKRLSVTLQQQKLIRQLTVKTEETVRWRAAHVLGAFPSEENVQCLLKLWDDSATGTWVRYGATRSLVETAARGTADLRRRVFDEFSTRSASLLADSRTLDEFARAVVLRHDMQPEDWSPNTAKVLQALFRLSEVPEEQERWRRLYRQVSAAKE